MGGHCPFLPVRCVGGGATLAISSSVLGFSLAGEAVAGELSGREWAQCTYSHHSLPTFPTVVKQMYDFDN